MEPIRIKKFQILTFLLSLQYTLSKTFKFTQNNSFFSIASSSVMPSKNGQTISFVTIKLAIKNKNSLNKNIQNSKTLLSHGSFLRKLIL